MFDTYNQLLNKINPVLTQMQRVQKYFSHSEFSNLDELFTNRERNQKIYIFVARIRAVSSVGLEHYLDRVGVTGSNPVQPT